MKKRSVKVLSMLLAAGLAVQPAVGAAGTGVLQVSAEESISLEAKTLGTENVNAGTEEEAGVRRLSSEEMDVCVAESFRA